MLRIRFGRQDVGRVSLTFVPHAETVGSVQALQVSAPSPVVERWRRTVAGRIPEAAQPLFDLIPPRGPVPDFLTPEVGVDSPRAAARLLATPTTVLERQLAGLRHQAAWVRRLGTGDRTELRRLARAVRAYHNACFASAWPQLQPMLVAELTRRMEQVTTFGAEAVLASLGPAFRWRDGVLEVEVPAAHVGAHADDVTLQGRGLRLVPSLFWPRPALAWDGFSRPALVYPVYPPPAPEPVATDPLVGLLGHTRAQTLRVLVTAHSTTALAARLHVSAASASAHAAALRRAGLVATHRQGRSVRHSLTPLGRALLAAQPPVDVSVVAE